MTENNTYLPIKAKILKITKETNIDYTFRVETDIKAKGGQFFEVSLPKIGEAPISISDYNDDYVDFTIRKVGKLTNVLLDLQEGDNLFIRGPYGNGFDIENYKNKHLIITAGGTGLAPVKSIISYFYKNPEQVKKLEVLLGFKSLSDILFQEEILKWKQNFNVVLTLDKGCNDTVLGNYPACEVWTGNVGLITKYINDFYVYDDTEIIVVGPPVMMKFTVKEFLKKNIPEEKIWVSYERKMSCGIGKCGHCKIDNTYICIDGPVFKFSEAKKLMD